MKYLQAFLKQAEKSQYPTKDTRQNRQKPLLSVLSVPSGRYPGNFLLSDPLAAPFHDDGRELESEADSWLCPYCGNPAVIDDVCPSLDGERTLTLWRCEPCQVVAVTPDTIRLPPSGWVSKVEQ